MEKLAEWEAFKALHAASSAAARWKLAASDEAERMTAGKIHDLIDISLDLWELWTLESEEA